MIIDSYTQYILTAEDGKILYNSENKIFSDQVYLGRNASVDAWVEITEAEKEQIEAEFDFS